MSIRRILFFLLLVMVVGAAMQPPPALRASSVGPPPDLPTLINDPGAWDRLTDQGKAGALIALDAVLLERYAAVRTAVAAERRTAREESTGVLILFVVVMVLFALLLLVVPFVFWFKYPGRRLPLFGYTLAAVLIFVPAGLLLLFPLGLYHEFSGDLAAHLDPVLALVDGSFDVARENAAELVVGHRVPVLQAAIEADPSEPWPGPHLEANLKGLRHAVDPTLRVAQQWLGVARFLPHFLMFFAGVLFLLGVREAFRDLVTLPTRAAAGRPQPLRTALKTLLRTLLREMLIVGALGLVLAVLTPVVQVVIRTLARDSVRTALVQVEAAAEYLGQSVEPDPNPVVAALSSVPAYLLVAIAIGGAASVLLLIHTRRVFRARLIAQRPLRSHDGYWYRAPVAVLALMGTPVVGAWLAATAAPMLGQVGSAGMRLTVLAITPWIAMGLVAVVAGVRRDVAYLVRFRVRCEEPDETAPSSEGATDDATSSPPTPSPRTDETTR